MKCGFTGLDCECMSLCTEGCREWEHFNEQYPNKEQKMEQKKVVVLGHDSYISPYRTYLRSKGFKTFISASYNHHLEKTLEVVGGTPALILFTGGQDINPGLYKEKYKHIFFNQLRDDWEEEWFNFAVKHKVPMLGTCRGMQMFTILTGGKLLRHVDHHTEDHEIYTPELLMVNSLHHQMCLPYPGTYKLLAWAHKQATQFDPPHHLSRLPLYDKTPVEPEALYFPEVKALGFQWHPEMMPLDSPAHKFVIKCLDTHLNLGEEEQ